MNKKKVFLVLITTLTCVITYKQAYASTYEVQEGDSLWTIAEKVLGNGSLWTEIAKNNTLFNPRLIHKGNLLNMPDINVTNQVIVPPIEEQIPELPERTPQPVGVNLLTNSDFETNNFGKINTWADRNIELNKWYLGFNQKENRTATWVNLAEIGEPYVGHAIKVDDYSDCGAWCSVSVTQQVYAEPGATYTLKARSKIVNGEGASLYLEFLNSSRNHIHIETTGTQIVGEWVEQSVTYTAPSGTEFISARLYSSNRVIGTKLWDDVELYKL